MCPGEDTSHDLKDNPLMTWLRVALFTLLLAPGVASAQVRVGVGVTVPGVRVVVAPPPPRAEVAPPPPSPAHTWVPGHWVWHPHHRRYLWQPGYYVAAPSPGYVWEPARWVNEGGAWVFYEGHWRASAPPPPAVAYEPPPPGAEIAVGTPPPAPIAEVVPGPPFAGAVWMPGYWHWGGARYVWIAGRYSAPRPGYVWEPHHWVRHGHRWHYVPGGWRQGRGHWRR